MTCLSIDLRCGFWALALLGACSEPGMRTCVEYPTWIQYVAFGPGQSRAEVSGLAGGDPIDCGQDPGAGGFVVRYADSVLRTDTIVISAVYDRSYDQWFYEGLSLPEDPRLSLVDAKSPSYDLHLWHPDSAMTVHIKSEYNPEHDLSVTFLDADGAVLAQTLVE